MNIWQSVIQQDQTLIDTHNPNQEMLSHLKMISCRYITNIHIVRKDIYIYFKNFLDKEYE